MEKLKMKKYLLTLNGVAIDCLADKSNKFDIDKKDLLARIIEDGLRSYDDNFGAESGSAGGVQVQELTLKMEKAIDEVERKTIEDGLASILYGGMSI